MNENTLARCDSNSSGSAGNAQGGGLAGAGFDARGGLMERAERLALLAFGLLFESLLVPVLWVMLALTLVTAVQRFVKVWRQASAPQVQPLGARWRSRRVGRANQRPRRRKPLSPGRRR